MKKEQYAEDLKEIRNIMDRSSRFSSLSGFSGVLIGIVAISSAYYINMSLFAHHDFLNYNRNVLTNGEVAHLLLVSVAVILASTFLGVLFTKREAIRNNENLWSFQSKRVLYNLMIPLVSGGFVLLILLHRGLVGLLPPLSLIFYGLALVNTSKYTVPNIRMLGIGEIICGLLGLYFIDLGLVFWGIGFGILHIINGIYMQVSK